MTSKMRPEKILAARAMVTSRAGQSILHGGENFRIANRLHQGSSQTNSAGQQALHALIRPENALVLRDRDHRFLHRVQQRLQRLTAVFHSAKTFFQLARGFVERRGHVSNFVARLFLNSRRQIAGGDSLGEIGNAHQPAANRLSCYERKQKC